MSIQDPHVRKRTLVNLSPGTAQTILTVSTGASSVNNVTYGMTGEEMTTSRRGSAWLTYQKLLRKARENGKTLGHSEVLRRSDFGNTFETVKRYVITNRDPMVNVDVVNSSGTRYRYVGPWFAKAYNVDKGSSLFPPVPGDLSSKMIMKGTTAVARTIPTNPVAGAAQFIGELREGLPSLPGRHTYTHRKASSLGDEYLNGAFGIAPLVNDLRKFGEAAMSSSDAIDQLKRDSGRLIRRRYTFPVERTITDPVVQNTAWYGAPGLRTASPSAYVGSGGGKLTFTREETYEYWFSGAYTYLYIDGDRAVDKMRAAEQRLNRLFGVRINPELLWELAPWSWAADWMGNAGDVFHNLSALSADSLVMRWGYIMCHYTCRDTYLAEGVSLQGNRSGPLSQTFVTDVKKRLKATPYGFGLDPDTAFTARQWAILSALGLSKGGRML